MILRYSAMDCINKLGVSDEIKKNCIGYIRHFNNNKELYKPHYKNVSDFISSAFIWDYTKEGHDFWSDMFGEFEKENKNI